MTINVGQLIVWLIIGSLAGFLAGLVVRGRGFGMLGNMLIGLVGALIGGLIFALLDIRITGLPTFTFSLADLLVAFIGAVILLLLARLVRR
jgi:uncharacterized membrane protein YeaQ/YmgE (transglycosylase-associated protein family)